jgi:hypothetical protein
LTNGIIGAQEDAGSAADMAIEGVTFETHEPGTLPESWRVGDYLLVSAGVWKDGKRGKVPIGSRLIQWGESLRFRGERRRFAHWNHSVWVSEDCLIEVSGAKVRESPYEKYRHVEFTVVHSNLTPQERDDADEFVRWVLARRPKFGFLTLTSISLSLLTGLRYTFGAPGTVICSGLVAAALGAPQWRENPSHVMPADLAEYADISI